jgi:hypothetical protein
LSRRFSGMRGEPARGWPGRFEILPGERFFMSDTTIYREHGFETRTRLSRRGSASGNRTSRSTFREHDQSGIGHKDLRQISNTCAVDLSCSHGPVHTVTLRTAVPSSFGLLNQLRRPPDTQPSVPRNSVSICPAGRPSRFASRVRSRMEIFDARRDLDFCRRYSVVVSPRPSRASRVLGIRPSK